MQIGNGRKSPNSCFDKNLRYYFYCFIMDKPRVKIYGERNSGTRYLAKLLRRNLRVELLRGVAPPQIVRALAVDHGLNLEEARDLYFQENYGQTLGWKHTRVLTAQQLSTYEISDRNLTFVSITKNPYAWLLSLHRRPYHQAHKRELTFEQFLTSPWPTVGRENADQEIAGPVELWNLKNRSYINLRDSGKALNLTYEAVLAEPKQQLDRIAEFCGCNWRRRGYTAVEFLNERQSKGVDYYRRYYLDEEWRQHLTPEAVTIINERLDRALLDFFQYALLES